jgi:phage gp36-like protein
MRILVLSCRIPYKQLLPIVYDRYCIVEYSSCSVATYYVYNKGLFGYIRQREVHALQVIDTMCGSVVYLGPNTDHAPLENGKYNLYDYVEVSICESSVVEKQSGSIRNRWCTVDSYWSLMKRGVVE